jgi:hypothetical protein
MYLTVTSVQEGQEQYRFLWGFYVRGFKPWHHCQKCFLGTRADGICPSMKNVPRLPLLRSMDYFYLCGYAKGPAANRGANNLHLAVEPADGETATITSNYGPVFTFEDARRIVIPESNAPRAAYGEFDYRCMNFRFGQLMYPTNLTGPAAAADKTPILRAR